MVLKSTLSLCSSGVMTEWAYISLTWDTSCKTKRVALLLVCEGNTCFHQNAALQQGSIIYRYWFFNNVSQFFQNNNNSPFPKALTNILGLVRYTAIILLTRIPACHRTKQAHLCLFLSQIITFSPWYWIII